LTELIVPVVLAGGRGIRLWPLLRAAQPTFLEIAILITLFWQTLQRCEDGVTRNEDEFGGA
jgi:mannose-1-phosphate guanylyltransferase